MKILKPYLAALFWLCLTLPLFAQEVLQAPPTTYDPSDPRAKLRSSLFSLEQEFLQAQREGIPPEAFTSSQEIVMIERGMVRIQAVAKKDVSLLIAGLEQLGANRIDKYDRTVNAWLPIDAISQLPNISGLQFVKPVYWVTGDIGAADSEGDSALQASAARRDYCVNGAGVRIGVISDSYTTAFPGGAAAGVASGDIPGVGNPNGFLTPVTVVNEGAPGIDEGRAMIEIVHDLAPGAQIFFNTSSGGEATYANAINNLASVSNCDVIVDDVRYFEEPFYMDGLIAQACDNVFSNGVPYFASAGNYANASYENPFRDSGGAFNAHDFDPGAGIDTLQRITVNAGSRINFTLQWDDPWGSITPNSAATNLDVFLFTTGGTLVAQATDNNVGNDPTEFFSYTAPGGVGTFSYNILIRRIAGPSPSMMKWVIRNSNGLVINEYPPTGVNDQSTGYGHSNAAGANAVAAAWWNRTPAYGTNPPQPEGFTSYGGVQIRYNTAGVAIIPVTRNKPEFCAADGTSNTFFGSGNNFFGTSAAAPHAAAVACLMLEADPSLTPTQVRNLLVNSSIDMLTAGFDFRTGSGLIQADVALSNIASAQCNISGITVQSGPTCTPNVANDYSVTLRISYSTIPCNDSLWVNGQKFAANGASFQDVTLTGLNPNGNAVSVTAYFLKAPGCNLTVNNLFTAPNAPKGTSGTEIAVCSGDPFSINLQSKINNFVTSDFTWTVNYNGLTNGNGAGSGDFINETLIKTTFNPVPQTAVYTITPTSETGGCQGSPFTVNKPVNPQPDIVDQPDTVTCDSLVFAPIVGTTLSGNQAYYTGPNKTGTKYLPGDILYASELTVLTIYIYDESGTVPNCTDQESFQLTIRGCAKLGDYTWQDLDEDGIQDPGEPPAAGMNVTLYRGLNNPYKQTTTDANGFYLFDSLFMDNNYYLRFTNLPQFHVFSPYEVGPNDSIDSDANPLGYTVIITLKSAEEDSTWDAGYYELLGEIGDRVWNDLNMNGQQNAGEPGVGGVQVDLYDCNNNFVAGTTTDGNGNYLFADLSSDDYYVKFSNLPPGYVFTSKNNAGANEDSDVNPNGQTDCNNLGPGQTDYNRDAGIYLKLSSVGDFVWCDDNRNGCQDLGESGIKGVTVTLYDGNDVAMASTTTNSYGRYRFDGLFPGVYRVGFSNLPAGFAFVPAAACGPDKDSDADPITGKTYFTSILAGEDVTYLDAGIFLPSGSIGDIVWNDLNRDGVRNIGEPGVAGISVYLYSSTFQALGFTSTDNNGYYNFTGLSAGGYYVAFGGLPQGWVFSPKGQGGNANFDSDVNAQGATNLITLATGSGRSDIDAGIYNPNANPPIVSGKVLLQGAYDSNTGLMRHDLNTQGLLPLLQPYMQAPWNYAGLAAVNNLPADVVDWVMIEFRSAADATQVIDQQVALLKDNGDIVGLDGFSPVYSPNLGGVSSAYLVVKHRNHLPVMSAAPVSITSNGFVYDFSGSMSALYTNNGLPNTPGIEVTSGGKVMMTQGDKNSDELVNSLDLGGIMSQYFRTGLNQGDVNLDGVTNSLDIGKAMQSYFRSSHVPR